MNVKLIKSLIIPIICMAQGSLSLAKNNEADKSMLYDDCRVRCEKPTFEPTKRDDKLYEFVVHIRCNIDGIKDSNEDLKDVLMDYINKTPSFEIESKKDGVYYRDQYGYKLSLKESRNTGHGEMEIDFDSYIVNTSNNNLLWESISNKIKAKSDAKNTKYEKRTLELNLSSVRDFSFENTKVVKIKKPFLAPTSIFISEVEKGLSKDITAEAMKMSDIFPK